MAPLQKDEKARQGNKNVSILPDTNILISKKQEEIENSIDFHTEIVNEIEHLLKNHEGKTKSEESESTQQLNIIQEEPLVEIRAPLNRKIETSTFQSNQKQDLSFFKHMTIPEEFKTEFHTFHNPSFKFISNLDSTDEVLHIKKPEEEHVEIIDLASLAVDSGAIQRKIEYYSMVKKDNEQTQNKKIDIIEIKKLGDNKMNVSSASNDQSESESDKTNIYYMKSKNAYKKNGTEHEKEQSYIPVDLNDKQKKLKEKEQQELKKQKEAEEKIDEKEERKQKKQEKKQKKLDGKNKKLTEKQTKKEEKKALIEKLKAEAEEKKRLKKQSKKAHKKGKSTDDIVQFVEPKSEEVLANHDIKKTFESNLAEPFEEDIIKNDHKTNPEESLIDRDVNKTIESTVDEVLAEDHNNKVQKAKPEEMLIDKNIKKPVESNLRETFADDSINKIQKAKPEESLINSENNKSVESKVEEVTVNDNIKKFQKAKPEDVLVDKDIKRTFESNLRETFADNSINKIQKAKPEDSLVDKEIIKVLLIADGLLGNLPEDVINNFLKSEDFKLYEKVIRKYKNK